MSANFTPNQNKYKNLTPFKCWLLNQINNWGLTNFPFVESDFDELTNYGMMMKFMKALNDVISNENKVEQDMTNLFGAFTELQQYVDSYLSTDTLQPLVNEKLDEMAESGQLEEIIASYLNANALWCFNSVEEMKSATNLINGSFAETLGFYEENDGGGSLYKIRTITNDDVVDNMTIIPLLDDSLIAELVFDKEINVLQLGMKKNVDFDNSNILQSIINKYDVMSLYFPLGTFIFNEEIEVENDITLKGFLKGKEASETSEESSVLYFKPENNNKTFLTQKSTSWQLNIENLTIYSPYREWTDNGLNDSLVPYSQYSSNSLYSNVNAIEYYNTTSIIKNVCINGFSGIAISAKKMLIYDAKISNCGTGILLIDNDISLYNPYITKCNTGIYASSGKNVMIYNGYLDLMVEYGINIDGYLSGIIDCYFDHINYSGINAKGINNFNGKVKCYRCGMYYSGSTIGELKSATLETEYANFSKASGISCLGELKNSIIILDSNLGNNSDSGSSSKYSPLASIYLRYNNNSILSTQDLDRIVVHTYNTQILYTSTKEGYSRFAKGSISTIPFLTKKTYAATGNQANEVGDLWMNTNNGKLWVATAIDGSTTTWKEISYVVE